MTQADMTARDELVAQFLFARFNHSDFRWNEILEYEKDGWRNDAKEALRLASRQDVSVPVETQRLADAMWQLLDDMGANGQSVCLAAKAEARAAYEPFRDTAVEYADWMSLADAEHILKECGQ